MLGSTRLASNFTIVKSSGLKAWKYEISTDPGADGGLSKINFDDALTLNVTNGTNHNYGKLGSSLVGFEVTLGASRDGTIENIRNL